MTIRKIPFKINFPLKILTNKKINFEDKNEREKLFKRHIYYYKYDNIKNSLLEQRCGVFHDLAKADTEYLKKAYPHLDILNISIFGSSLYSKNNSDFDCLVITKGNVFDHFAKRLNNTNIELSIKGIENFTKGILDYNSSTSLTLQRKIVDRTAISLYRRHLPIYGYDFVNNKHTFLQNGYAQVSDLLNNAYELYYLKEKRPNMSDNDRSRKILSRLNETIS